MFQRVGTIPQQRPIALTALRMYIISIRYSYLSYIGVLLHELRIRDGMYQASESDFCS